MCLNAYYVLFSPHDFTVKHKRQFSLHGQEERLASSDYFTYKNNMKMGKLYHLAH